MNDTLVQDTISHVVDTVAKVAQVTTEASHEAQTFGDYFSPSIFVHDPFYWIGAAVIVISALFIGRYVYFTDNYGGGKSSQPNIVTIIFCILAFIPIVKWFTVFILFMFFVVAGSDNMARIDKNKLFSDKVTNFLFNDAYRPKKTEEEKESKKKSKEFKRSRNENDNIKYL